MGKNDYFTIQIELRVAGNEFRVASCVLPVWIQKQYV